MKPRRTPDSNLCLTLPGGNEDNFLWAQVINPEGIPVVCSVWSLSAEEREAIAAGANVELLVWGNRHPLVAVEVTGCALGRAAA